MSHLKDLLNQIGRETVKLIDNEIVRQNLIKTGALRNSIEYNVIMNSKAEWRLTFTQIYYGFFLDSGTRKISARNFFQKYITDQIDKYTPDITEATALDLLDDL